MQKMKKTIILMPFIIIMCVSGIKAQTKQVLFENKSIKVVHVRDLNSKLKGRESVYPFANFYYIEDNNHIDTISIAFSSPKSVAFYDGKYISFTHQYINQYSSCYCVFEKIDNKWQLLVQHCDGTNGFNQTYEINQLSIFEIEEIISNNGIVSKNSYTFDTEKRRYIKLSKNENGTENQKIYFFPKIMHKKYITQY